MEQLKRVGPKAASIKYDLLTALNVTGLHGTPTEQTSITRLILLITARYNWRLEEVSIGHSELAALWGVDPRTVKREMKRLMAMGLLMCIRAGVRGRVGAYRLNYRQIYTLSRPSWAAVGPDFEDRMIEVSGERTVVKVDFQPTATVLPINDTGTWGAVRQKLKADHPALFENWFAKLTSDNIGSHSLTLRAPNGFVSRYIETHFDGILARAVDAALPTDDGKPRKITLVSP